MSAPTHSTLHGIYLKMASLVLFCTMDAMVKELGDTYGAFQIMMFRSIVALVPLAFVIHHAGGFHVVKSKRPWLQAARVVSGFASLFGFFYVFPRMPLVDAYAISFAAPSSWWRLPSRCSASRSAGAAGAPSRWASPA